MNKIQEIRLRNLKVLLSEFGSQRAMADAIEVNKSYLSQMFSGYPIGEKTARKIEKAAGKPSLWLDQDGALSPKQLELIQKVRNFPDEHLHILSAFVDSLSQVNKKN